MITTGKPRESTMRKGIGSTGFICFAAALGGYLFGFDTAVISGTIELVKGQFNMDAVTEGWFVSSGLLGSIIGVIIAGLLSDTIGRKNVLILSAVLFLASGVGCAWSRFSRYAGLVPAGRGYRRGSSFGYFADVHCRICSGRSWGKMIASYQLAITAGILLAYVSNAFLVELNGYYSAE